VTSVFLSTVVHVLEIEPSPMRDRTFGTVFPRDHRLDLSLDTFYRKMKTYLIVRSSRGYALCINFLTYFHAHTHSVRQSETWSAEWTLLTMKRPMRSCPTSELPACLYQSRSNHTASSCHIIIIIINSTSSASSRQQSVQYDTIRYDALYLCEPKS